MLGPDGLHAEWTWGDKVRYQRRFKFVLAFENSNRYEDWVTEKVFHASLSGALPVYWGARNVADWVPQHSLVDARDFADPAALAAFLKELAGDEARYRTYFAWKQLPLPPHFTKMIDRCAYSSQCRVCQYAHSRRCGD